MYGSNVNAAAILLASEGNVPLERTAMLMAALLGCTGVDRVRRPRPGARRPTPGRGWVR